MSRLLLSPEHAALIGEQKPCDTCGGRRYVAGQQGHYWSEPCPDCRPVVSWWSSPDPLPIGERCEIELGPCAWCDTYQHDPSYHAPPLPGAVLATAVVTDCVPVMDGEIEVTETHITVYDDGDAELWTWHDPPIDGEVWWTSMPLSDHVALGLTYTPGQHAVQLDQIEVTE